MNSLLLLSHTRPPHFLSLYPPLLFHRENPTKLCLRPNLTRSAISFHIHNPSSRRPHSRFEAPVYTSGRGETFAGPMEIEELGEDLSLDGPVYQKTLRLVECSMFAALAGLAYFLSNSLSIENYFGCFFPLPIVISSMRWGIAAGRKTMVATAVLLLVLSGPLKALTYLLTHGFLGLAMGSMWRMGASWSVSISLCTLVRALGALGYVSVTSFLIRENILSLITISLHASISLILTASGINALPSMNLIYTIFGIVLLLNSVFLVLLLHLLYSVFLTRLGMRTLLKLPRWLEKAI